MDNSIFEKKIWKIASNTTLLVTLFIFTLTTFTFTFNEG